MARVVKLGLVAISIAVALVASGYAVAWLKADECRAMVSRELESHPTFGMDMRARKIRVAPESVSARVTGPLEVETEYVVPYDLHESIHRQRFAVLPWSIKPSDPQVIHLM